jgi:hypothetical protein
MKSKEQKYNEATERNVKTFIHTYCRHQRLSLMQIKSILGIRQTDLRFDETLIPLAKQVKGK